MVKPIATYLATNTDVAQLNSGDASEWTLIRHSIATRVGGMRDDIHLILQQHHV